MLAGAGWRLCWAQTSPGESARNAQALFSTHPELNRTLNGSRAACHGRVVPPIGSGRLWLCSSAGCRVRRHGPAVVGATRRFACHWSRWSREGMSSRELNRRPHHGAATRRERPGRARSAAMGCLVGRTDRARALDRGARHDAKDLSLGLGPPATTGGAVRRHAWRATGRPRLSLSVGGRSRALGVGVAHSH